MFVNVPIGLAVWAWLVALHETRVATVTSTCRRPHLHPWRYVLASVLGLVEAASDGGRAPPPLGSLAVGILLLGAFVHIEARAEEPILPLRLFANATRTTANVARGLVSSPACSGCSSSWCQVPPGRGWLLPAAGPASPSSPSPTAVFLSSQLCEQGPGEQDPSQDTLMLSGPSASTITSLLLTSQLHAPGRRIPKSLLSLVLLLAWAPGTSPWCHSPARRLADVAPREMPGRPRAWST